MMTRSAIKSPLTRYQGVDTKLRTPGSPRPPYRMEGADAATGCWVWATPAERRVQAPVYEVRTL
jgi:hypothetical protein